MTKLEVNGDTIEVDNEIEMPLLWVLREKLGLTGTKFGCGKFRPAECHHDRLHRHGGPGRGRAGIGCHERSTARARPVPAKRRGGEYRVVPELV